MQKYETVPVLVEAQQFLLDRSGSTTPFGIGQCECYCDAMDGRVCPQHGDFRARLYATDFGRGNPVSVGDWVVRYPNGLEMVHSPEEFGRLYRKVIG